MDKKTNLTDAELKQFRQMLMDRRDLMLGSYHDLVEEVREKNLPDKSGAQSTMPTHQADLALDDELNDETLAMAEHERELLVEIDDALRRIDSGTYGICEATGKPISKDRLRAKPWARYGVEQARETPMKRKRLDL